MGSEFAIEQPWPNGQSLDSGMVWFTSLRWPPRRIPLVLSPQSERRHFHGAFVHPQPRASRTAADIHRSCRARHPEASLEGIDAPENAQSNGKAITDALRAHVAEGPYYPLPTGKDRYGRTRTRVEARAGSPGHGVAFCALPSR